MGDLFFEQPAINSPDTYPARHWELDDQGQPIQKVMSLKKDINRTGEVIENGK